MKKELMIILLAFFTLNLVRSQTETIPQLKFGPDVSKYPPLYFLDGFKISQKQFAELNIDKLCIKKIKVDENYSSSDSTSTFKGAVFISSKLLVVLNDKNLFNIKDKYKHLSKLEQGEILSFIFIDKNEASNKYGKLGKYGALIIKTKK